MPRLQAVRHFDAGRVHAEAAMEGEAATPGTYTWTSKMPKIMDPVLPKLSIVGYWAIILGTFGGPGKVDGVPPSYKVGGFRVARTRRPLGAKQPRGTYLELPGTSNKGRHRFIRSLSGRLPDDRPFPLRGFAQCGFRFRNPQVGTASTLPYCW